MLNWIVCKRTDYSYKNWFGIKKPTTVDMPKNPTNQPTNQTNKQPTMWPLITLLIIMLCSFLFQIRK